MAECINRGEGGYGFKNLKRKRYDWKIWLIKDKHDMKKRRLFSKFKRYKKDMQKLNLNFFYASKK